MLIRSDVAPEQRQAGVAIALFQIAEHLVVGPVLFHDEQHVPDGRRRTTGWESRTRRSHLTSRAAHRDECVVVDLFGELGERLRVRCVDERHEAIS